VVGAKLNFKFHLFYDSDMPQIQISAFPVRTKEQTEAFAGEPINNNAVNNACAVRRLRT
jgi:hypothetical protein